MKKIVILLFLISHLTLSAQDFNEAFGVRAGYRAGVMYKNCFDYENSLQAMMNFQRGGVQLTFVRQFYQPFITGSMHKIFFYYGVGGHLGYSRWSNEQYIIQGEKYNRREFSVGIGIDANLGLEYHSPKRPVIIALDYLPFFEFNVPLYFRKNYLDFALVILYRF